MVKSKSYKLHFKHLFAFVHYFCSQTSNVKRWSWLGYLISKSLLEPIHGLFQGLLHLINPYGKRIFTNLFHILHLDKEATSKLKNDFAWTQLVHDRLHFCNKFRVFHFFNFVTSIPEDTEPRGLLEPHFKTLFTVDILLDGYLFLGRQ